MPRRDGTGPMGMGSMTGRGAGICEGYAPTGYVNLLGGYSRFGCGKGFRRIFNAIGILGRDRFCGANSNRKYASGVGKKELLIRQAKILENQLAEVKKHLSSIDESAEK